MKVKQDYNETSGHPHHLNHKSHRGIKQYKTVVSRDWGDRKVGRNRKMLTHGTNLGEEPNSSVPMNDRASVDQ